MIMEPLRGGQLAQNQPRAIQEIFAKSKTQHTNIEWAFNYLWNLSEVNCVLSGMSNLSQVKENIALSSNVLENLVLSKLKHEK